MSGEITIARDSDLRALVAAFGQELFFADRLDRQRRGLGELFVAWADGVPVGDVYLWRQEAVETPVRQHLGRTPTISHLEVSPPHQNRGHGTALVRAAEERAADLGHARICLGVGIDNGDARRLYERLGYREWQHGLVTVEWEDEGGPDSLTCHWLVKQLPGQ